MTAPAPELPPPDEWPKELKTFLVHQLQARYFAPFGPTPEGKAEGWRMLLAVTFRGRRLGGEWIPWAASPAECYAHARRYLEERVPLTTANPAAKEPRPAR